MRLFIAIELDEPARLAIAAEQKRLARALAGADRGALKWTRPEHMHLTLVFLGEVDEAVVPRVVDVVQEPIAQPPFEISFPGVGVFPPRGAPRVLWLGVDSGGAQVSAVQQELVDRLARIGIVLEERPFHPHLTLARWRTSRPSDTGRALRAGRPDEIARIEATEATLFQSRLEPSGPTHTPLARAPFRVGHRLE